MYSTCQQKEARNNLFHQYGYQGLFDRTYRDFPIKDGPTSIALIGYSIKIIKEPS